MSIRNQFLSVNNCGVRLFHEHQEEPYAHWLVVTASHCDGNLYQRTNIEALVALLQRKQGDNAAKLLTGEHTEAIAAVHPDNDVALTMAANLVPEMDHGTHLDLALFHRERDQLVIEYWDDLKIPQRISVLKALSAPPAFCVSKAPPECLISSLYDHVEGNPD